MQQYPKSLTTWGDHIRKRRLDLKLTKVQAAALIGTNVDSLWHWEFNQATPHVRFRPAIIKFLGYCPEAALGDFPGGLHLLRTQLGLSSRVLAKRLGTTQSTILRWENGTNKPLASVCRRLELMFKGAGIRIPKDFQGRKTGRPPKQRSKLSRRRVGK